MLTQPEMKVGCDDAERLRFCAHPGGQAGRAVQRWAVAFSLDL